MTKDKWIDFAVDALLQNGIEQAKQAVLRHNATGIATVVLALEPICHEVLEVIRTEAHIAERVLRHTYPHATLTVVSDRNGAHAHIDLHAEKGIKLGLRQTLEQTDRSASTSKCRPYNPGDHRSNS